MATLVGRDSVYGIAFVALGVAGIGVGVTDLLEGDTLVGVGRIGGGVTGLLEGGNLFGVALIGLGVAGIGLGVLILQNTSLMGLIKALTHEPTGEDLER